MAERTAAIADTSEAGSSSQQLLRESDFSTSSVDRFLREHGFDINDHAGLELSSLSDDDYDAVSSNSPIDNGAPDVVARGEQTEDRSRAARTGGTTLTPIARTSSGDAANDDDSDDELLASGSLQSSSGRDGDDAQRSFLDGGQSASEEEEPVTPRFTLLHDKDLLLVEGASEPAAEAELSDLDLSDYRAEQIEQARATPPPPPPHQQQQQQQSEHDADDRRDSLDRSLVLGVGSGFSGFSSGATDERSRIAQTLHEEEQQHVRASMLQQRSDLPPRQPQQQQLSRHASGSNGTLSSLPGSFMSGSRRVLDDELSDALGVTVSTPEQDISALTARDASSHISRASSQRGATQATATATPAARHSVTGSSARPSQRALFVAGEGEQKHNERGTTTTTATVSRGSFQLPPAHTSATAASRSRSASVPSVQRHVSAALDRTGDSAGDGSGSGSWNELNDKLRTHGLQTIAFDRVDARGDMTLPNRESLFNLVQDVVLQLERKDQIIQDIILESNRNSREQSRAEDDRASAEKKTEAIQSALESAKSDVMRLQAKLKQSKDEADDQAKQLKQSCLRLQQQLKVSEHRVKAKEVLVERMQLKLQQHVDRESQSKSRDAHVFRQLTQRDVKKTSARDSQTLDAIGVLEAQRETMQRELDALQGQVTALNAELRDKDNYIARRAAASVKREIASWDDDVDDDADTVVERNAHGSRRQRPSANPSVVSDDMLLERLEAARRDQEQAASTLRRREAAMLQKVSNIEHELVAAREMIAELKEENANLMLEAESRPSIRDYRLAQRRIHQLERQVSESKLALQDATDLHELRKYMGTKELVERDRLNHRLYLNRLHALPRETALEVVKDVCRVLHLTDITLIAPSLEKLCRVVAAVPRMEKFIRDVCGFVFLHTSQDDGSAGTGAEDRAGFELEQVLPTLQQWMVERRKLHALEEFKSSMITELCKRSVEPIALSNASVSAASQPTNLSRAVHIVSELIELEKNVLHHREIYSQAAEELERRPSVLVNQIVRHFSHLFQVKSVEGVLPKINAIYLFVNEMENFLTVVRGLLQLKPQAPVTVCLNAIRDKLEGDERSSPVQPHERRENSDPNAHAPPNFVVEKHTATAAAATGVGDLAGVRQVREMTILVRELKRELGAANMHEILPRTKRLMELLSLSIHNTSFDDDDDD